MRSGLRGALAAEQRPRAPQVFTESTHIVAVKAGGAAHVYCHQAVEELNIKPKNWKCVRVCARAACTRLR